MIEVAISTNESPLRPPYGIVISDKRMDFMPSLWNCLFDKRIRQLTDESGEIFPSLGRPFFGATSKKSPPTSPADFSLLRQLTDPLEMNSSGEECSQDSFFEIITHSIICLTFVLMSRLFAQHWKDYELIDAGNEKKLERWGDVVTIRPERNAYFKSVMPETEWKKKAHFEFIEKTANSGEWKEIIASHRDGKNKSWQIKFDQLTLNLKLTQFKHLGIFPEQRINWDFVSANLKEGDRFLNLFGYTGAVSLAARQKGADVYHCDSVKQIISWGKENMESSGLADIHWVEEDAMKFASREVKRGNQYKGIIMDPPAFGLGANKERWKIEDKFPELLELAKSLKKHDGFVIVNTYSPRLEIQKIKEIAHVVFPKNKVEVNKLCIESTTKKIIEYGELTLIN